MIPTAEEFINEKLTSNPKYIFTDNELYFQMREFAKLHVKAALESACKKAYSYIEYDMADGSPKQSYVSETSIIDAYPLTNIK